MKTLTTMILMLTLFAQSVFAADCDYSKIVDNGNGTYTYSKALHICVGNMKKDLEAANTQIASYQQAISLKDLALKDSDIRANTWMNNSLKLEDTLNKVNSIESSNKIIYFGLGILVSGMAVYGAAKLSGH